MSVRDYLFALITFLLVIAIAAACSDSGTTSMPVADEPAVTGGLDSFPAPGALKEISSLTPAGGFLAGDDCDTALPMQGVEFKYGNLRLVARESDDLAYAFYRFELAGVANDTLELGWSAISESIVLDKELVRGDVFVGLADPSTGAWDWFDILEPVPAAGNLNDYVSEGSLLLAVVSMSYADISINYVRAAESDWVVEEVPLTDVWWDLVSADIDSNDQVHICSTRKYARQTPTGWEVEPLVEDNGGSLGAVLHLHIDADDTAHVSCYESFDWSLGGYSFLTYGSMGWIDRWSVGFIESNPIDAPPYSGRRYGISMALDSQSRPHFAYFMERERDLYYNGPNSDGTRSEMIVDADGLTGEQCVISVDSTDKPHIVYHANDHTAGRHAWLEEGVWQVEDVFEGNSFGVDLEINHYDMLLAGFTVDPTPFVPGSAWLYTNNGSWQANEIGFSSGGGCYLELNSDGRPTMLYRRYLNQPLRIESWQIGHGWTHSWVDIPADGVPDLPGYDLRYMRDSQDKPHIVYAYGDNGEDKTVVHAYRR